eukprot:285865_1
MTLLTLFRGAGRSDTPKTKLRQRKRSRFQLSSLALTLCAVILAWNNISILFDLQHNAYVKNVDGLSDGLLLSDGESSSSKVQEFLDLLQVAAADQEATLHRWKSIAHDLANALSVSSSSSSAKVSASASLPSPQKPFVFFHLRKAAGSSLRSIIDEMAQDLDLPQWIPCKNGVPCVPSSMPPPGEDGNEKAVYAGHVNYNHMSQLVRQRYAKTSTITDDSNSKVVKTLTFKDLSTGREHNNTYFSLQDDNLYNSKFGSCLTNIRPTVSRVVSCWNYRFLHDVRGKLDVPVASNATVEELTAMLPEAVDKFGNGCNNEIARIFGRTNDENLLNHLSVKTYGPKYFLDELETVMSRMASCVVVRMDRCEDSNVILKHFLPWMHSEDLCESAREKQSSLSGVVSDEAREAILAQNSFDELVFRFGEELFEAQLEVASKGRENE